METRVELESATSRDITREYLELERQLASAEVAEKQYLVLLGQAKDVDDILKIYQVLYQVRLETQLIVERMQYLEQTSPIVLPALWAKPAYAAKALPTASVRIPRVLKLAVRGLAISWLIVASIAIWLIMIPAWATVLGAICWRRRAKKRLATERAGAGA